MNPRVFKTKETLLDSLVCLMQNKDLSEITVSELCLAANVNRTTFYKYFEKPEDVLVDAVARTFITFRYDSKDRKSSIQTYIYDACAFVYTNKELSACLLKTNIDIARVVLGIKAEGYNLAFLSNYQNAFICGGTSSMLTSWIVGGFKETPEELTSIIMKFVESLLGKPDKDGVPFYDTNN